MIYRKNLNKSGVCDSRNDLKESRTSLQCLHKPVSDNKSKTAGPHSRSSRAQ